MKGYERISKFLWVKIGYNFFIETEYSEILEVIVLMMEQFLKLIGLSRVCYLWFQLENIRILWFAYSFQKHNRTPKTSGTSSGFEKEML